MLQLIYRVAGPLYRFRGLILLAGAMATIAFGVILFSADPSLEPYLLLAALALGWSLSLYGVAAGFRQPPEPVEAEDGWWLRFKKRFKLALAGAWAGAFALASLGLLYLSLRAISLTLS